MNEQQEQRLIAIWLEIQITERKLLELRTDLDKLSSQAGISHFKVRLEPVETIKVETLKKVEG